MKKNRIFGALSAVSLLLAGACSNDLIDQGSQNGGPNGEDADDELFISVNFDLPSAKETRSFTNGENSSNSGTEIGHDYENTVTTAYIVLAKTDNTFISASKVTEKNIDPVGTSGISYRSTSTFSKTDLETFYQSVGPNDMDADGFNVINVFVFVNPTPGLIDVIDPVNGQVDAQNWYNKVGVYYENNEGSNSESSVIWEKDKFLMSNNNLAPRRIPSSIEEWDAFSTKATAFNLSGMNNFGRPNEIDNLAKGNVLVERAAARYDFRDGALDGVADKGMNEDFNGFKDQTYHVVLDAAKQPLVDVFLGKMSMVNMNTEYYFLRRVSDNGLMTGNNLKICGPELPWYSDATGSPANPQNGNYVVDAFASWKENEPTFGFSAHFNYPFFNEDGVMDNAETSSDSWDTYLISDVLKNGASDSWNAAEGKGRYKTWRYLTEGTIPGQSDKQQNGVSNGIVFKGQLLPAREADTEKDDEFTQKLLNALKISDDGNKLHDPILYVFGGHIYCTWEHIQRWAIAQALLELKWNENQNRWEFRIDRSNTLYNAVFGTGGFGSIKFTCDIAGTLDNADFLKAGSETLEDYQIKELDPAAPNTLWEAWKRDFPGDNDEIDNEAEQGAFDVFRNAAVAANIALYQTSYDEALGGWGYYCYYYYWNRHNDNGMAGVMGPMEFAVVRNNVYKLAVTKIARLGHPRIAANDPDAPTPNTPDEKGDVYITVTCTTLPWVVRENNIHLGE